MFDGFASGLDFVVFMLAMDCAFWAYWSVASEAEISELLILVVSARVHDLIACVFVDGVGIAGLRDGSRRVILAGRSLLVLFVSVEVTVLGFGILTRLSIIMRLVIAFSFRLILL